MAAVYSEPGKSGTGRTGSVGKGGGAMQPVQKEALTALVGLYAVLSVILLGGGAYAAEMRTELVGIWFALSAFLRLSLEAALVILLSRRRQPPDSGAGRTPDA